MVVCVDSASDAEETAPADLDAAYAAADDCCDALEAADHDQEEEEEEAAAVEDALLAAALADDDVDDDAFAEVSQASTSQQRNIYGRFDTACGFKICPR